MNREKYNKCDVIEKDIYLFTRCLFIYYYIYENFHDKNRLN